MLLLLAAGVILLFRAIFKDWHYAGYLAFLILFLFFTYGHLHNILVEKLPGEHAAVYPYALLAVQAAVLAGLGLRRTWRRLGGARITPLLNLVFAFTLISQAGVGLAELARRLPAPGAQPGVSALYPRFRTGHTTRLLAQPGYLLDYPGWVRPGGRAGGNL